MEYTINDLPLILTDILLYNCNVAPVRNYVSHLRASNAEQTYRVAQWLSGMSFAVATHSYSFVEENEIL